MQTLEAIFSLSFLILTSLLVLTPQENQIDDSLYHAQLANDVWRILYLNNDFQDFSFTTGNQARDRAESDLIQITKLTSLCVFIGGEKLTSCRGEEVGSQLITLEKILVVDGTPQKVTLSLTHRL